MRFELIPEFRDDKPYLVATSEAGWEATWMGVPNGTDAEVLKIAEGKDPKGRAFRVNRDRPLGLSWGNSVLVEYEKPYPRWFVEIGTMQELLAVIAALGGLVHVQGNVIKEYVE